MSYQRVSTSVALSGLTALECDSPMNSDSSAASGYRTPPCTAGGRTPRPSHGPRSVARAAMPTFGLAPGQGSAVAALPPGPRGLPVVGDGIAFRRNQLAFVAGMQRTQGNAVTVGLGRAGRLFLFSAPEAVERMLVTNAANCTSREINQPSMPFLGDGLRNVDGEFPTGASGPWCSRPSAAGAWSATRPPCWSRRSGCWPAGRRTGSSTSMGRCRG